MERTGVGDEFNGDNFDHGPHGFVGGGYLGQVQTNGRPIETTPVPKGTPRWGAKWKEAVRDNYLSNIKGGSIHGSMYSYRDVYLDHDPTYKDRFGRPMLRMTIDFHDNELKAAEFMTDKYAEIVKAMGAQTVEKKPRKCPYDATTYQTTHLNGGAVMGADPKTSAINRYLQSWDVANLFVMGASAFPQNAGYNPTGTVAALAYWSAKAIREQYLKNPGPLGIVDIFNTLFTCAMAPGLSMLPRGVDAARCGRFVWTVRRAIWPRLPMRHAAPKSKAARLTRFTMNTSREPCVAVRA